MIMSNVTDHNDLSIDHGSQNEEKFSTMCSVTAEDVYFEHLI
jgi:hypothetical protein